MENYVMRNTNDNFLSESYCQSIERITGTEDNIFNFQISKKLLKRREKAWVNLFGKYSKEMSGDIELNVDTLEFDEEEIEKQNCEEEYSYEQRKPMRKTATLIQYWINTGNLSYKAFLENELSETEGSLSERELTFSSYSTIINENNKQEYKSESSYSSINTAAYILSNTNITNKADTTAIIKSIKYDKNINSKNIEDIKITSNNKIQCIENARINCMTHNDNVNINVPDIELCLISKEYKALKPCDQLTSNIVTSGNTIQPNVYSQNEQTDKMNVLSTSQRSLDIQNREEFDIVWQFDKTSKQLSEDGKNNSASNKYKMLEKNISYEEGMSENAQEIITKDKNLTAFCRKKLYTGRNSPVDLIQTKKHSISRLFKEKQSLHPALDSECMIKRKTLLVHKSKNKNLPSFRKSNLEFKKMKRKKRTKNFSDKNITDTNSESSNNRIQNDIIDSSFEILSDHNSLNKEDNSLLLECNDVNIFKKNGTCKQDLASLNMNPIVLLEQIIPPFKRHESKTAKNNHVTRKSNVHNYKHVNEFNKLHNCEIENRKLETIESDESTNIIYQSKTNGQHSISFSKDSDYSLNLSVKDFSANTEEKDSKLLNLKNTAVNQNKKSNHNQITNTSEKLSLCLSINGENHTNVRRQEIIMERLSSPTKSQILNKDDTIQQKNIFNKSRIFSSNSYKADKIDNMRFQDVKVILEKLPASVNKNSYNIIMGTEFLNKNDIQQKEILNKFKTHSSMSHGINKKDDLKLKEIKIVLERLPPNICFDNTNIFVDKNIISENANLYNNKQKHRIEKMSKILACENVEPFIQTIDKVNHDYSFGMHIKSKKYNDPKISDTSNIAEKHEIFDKTESEFPIQYRNNNKINQNNHSKYSVLTFISSDEDDLFRSMQHPQKKLKSSKNNKPLDEINTIEKYLFDVDNYVTNKDKYHCDTNLKNITFSSNDPKIIRKTFETTFETIKEKRDSSEIKIKSFDNTTTASKMCENGKFLISNENDNDSIAKNLDERKKRAFFNYNKSINNSNKKHLNTIVKKNGIDYKDDTCSIFFQTKTFCSDSEEFLDSKENNSYTASTRKAFKNSFVNYKSQYHNHANFEEFFNDSITKRYNKKHSNSLNSSFEKHDVAPQIYDVKIGLGLTKKSKISKRLDEEFNEEFNYNIYSRINNKRKNISSHFINDTSIGDTTVIHQHKMQKKMFSNISLGKNNFSLSKK